MPTSFSALKTATKPNLENYPPYAAVSTLMKPQHMVAFLRLEIVLFPQNMKKPGLRTGAKANLCGVRLLPKQVLDEIADKEKAVQKRGVFRPLWTAFRLSFIISELKKVVNW